MKAALERARLVLRGWGRTEARVNELKDELKWAKLAAEDVRATLGAQKLTGMPGGRKQRDLSDVMVRLEKAEAAFAAAAERADQGIAEALLQKCMVDDMLAKIPEGQREVLRMWYRKGMDHLQIARALNYSVDRVRHLKVEGDASFAKMLEGMQVDIF